MSEIDPHSTVSRRVLIGCGSAKREETSAARDLYTSDFFRKRERYGAEFGHDFYIISAKHHVLDPDESIAPYDRTITELDGEAVTEWAEETASQIRSLDWEGIDIVDVLLGLDYLQPLKEHGAFTRIPATPTFPFQEHAGNGEQKQWMKQCLTGAASLPQPETEQTTIMGYF